MGQVMQLRTNCLRIQLLEKIAVLGDDSCQPLNLQAGLVSKLQDPCNFTKKQNALAVAGQQSRRTQHANYKLPHQNQKGQHLRRKYPQVASCSVRPLLQKMRGHEPNFLGKVNRDKKLSTCSTLIPALCICDTRKPNSEVAMP